MEDKITKIYSNHKNEIQSLSMENLSYLHNYFRHEFNYSKSLLNQSSLECIKDRKKISIIYKSLNSEIKKRFS